MDEARKIDGTVGSRMTGAGFGGCTVSIVNEDAVETFIRDVGKGYTGKTGLVADFYVAEIGDGSKQISVILPDQQAGFDQPGILRRGPHHDLVCALLNQVFASLRIVIFKLFRAQRHGHHTGLPMIDKYPLKSTSAPLTACPLWSLA